MRYRSNLSSSASVEKYLYCYIFYINLNFYLLLNFNWNADLVYYEELLKEIQKFILASLIFVMQFPLFILA